MWVASVIQRCMLHLFCKDCIGALMRRKWMMIIAVGVVALGGVAVFVGQMVRDGGAFRSVAPHFSGRCERVSGVIGAEDIVVDARLQRAYISATDRRAIAEGRAAAGGIYAYDLAAKGTPRLLDSDFGGPFFPHGISLYQGPAGETRLFAVNHPTMDETTVEIFQLEAGERLRHLRSISGPELPSGNDLVAVGPEQFYISKDADTVVTDWLRLVESFLRMPWSSVLYHDGTSFRVVVDDLRYANGVATSQDGTEFYVTETTGLRFLAYDIDQSSGELSPKYAVEFDSALDNLSLAADGRLWLAAHPKLFDFLGHAKDAQNRSASQVLVLSPSADGVAHQEIYLNAGEEISGSSVAVPVGDSRFLVGSVFEPFFLDCQLDQPTS